jgi:hypothetical protein
MFTLDYTKSYTYLNGYVIIKALDSHELALLRRNGFDLDAPEIRAYCLSKHVSK